VILPIFRGSSWAIARYKFLNRTTSHWVNHFSYRSEVTFVTVVEYAVIINVIVADIAKSVIIPIVLTSICNCRTIIDFIIHTVTVEITVADIALPVIINIALVWIEDQRTVVIAIEDAIVIIIIVTCISVAA